MKIKKRIEERKKGFPIKDQKEVKREKKQFSINERKWNEESFGNIQKRQQEAKRRILEFDEQNALGRLDQAQISDRKKVQEEF